MINILIPYNVIAALILIIVCHHENLSQYYWLVFSFTHLTHPLTSGNHPFGLCFHESVFILFCFILFCLLETQSFGLENPQIVTSGPLQPTRRKAAIHSFAYCSLLGWLSRTWSAHLPKKYLIIPPEMWLLIDSSLFQSQSSIPPLTWGTNRGSEQGSKPAKSGWSPTLARGLEGLRIIYRLQYLISETRTLYEMIQNPTSHYKMLFKKVISDSNSIFLSWYQNSQ